MKPEDLPKIRSLSLRTRTRNDATHHGLEGPYWQGHYQEDGKRITVYIGRHLPAELLALLKLKYKKPGAKQFTWPRPADQP